DWSVTGVQTCALPIFDELVLDDHPPLPVEDAAAHRRLGDDADPVGAGLGREALGGRDLEEPEAREQRREEGDHDDADDAETYSADRKSVREGKRVRSG